MQLQALLPQAAQRLQAAGVSGAMADARALLAFAAGIAPERLTLHLQDPCPPALIPAFDALIAQRARRVPVSHLIGSRLFWGRRFQVTADVLDPRPETETLIAAALALPYKRVLDLGTGSGCILLTLIAERPGAYGLGVDMSEKALVVAQENARRLQVGRVTFAQSNWFDAVSGRFDLIVANPPYIAASEMATLAPELDYEPRSALTDEGDGLSAYRHITARALDFLNENGSLLFEIGYGQARDVCEIARRYGFGAPRVLKDMDGRDRAILAQLT